ncbi:hypothetical protein EJV47_11870 [Hymenobacter gummosus]|uniref:Uncharacterized protein n=1 Tax=Hymenobacter gummosus TaxID=1776032 RepID=A0A3S0J9U8_9BACT|nr:hypothetical protein [Hymenobacter gummosus]RTQ49519.1 hypothetical protein EJV47_11870 [Hymenobacter gummosus]
MLTLTAKSWQVFLIMMVAVLLMNFSIRDMPLATDILFVLGAVIYYGWFAVIGNTLADWLPRGADYSRTWFLLDAFLVLAALCLTGVMFESRSYTATGVAALPGFYLLFAFFHVFWFPAVVLVAIEKQRRPEFGFYFGTFLLMLFWPIGLWFVQPRLNRIAAERFA